MSFLRYISTQAIGNCDIVIFSKEVIILTLWNSGSCIGLIFQNVLFEAIFTLVTMADMVIRD